MFGVGVVDADDLENVVSNADRRVFVFQNFYAAIDQRFFYGSGLGPMIVISENGKSGTIDTFHEFSEVMQIKFAMAHKIAGENDHIWILCERQVDCLHLYIERCYAPDVLIG